jgi:broad specificity phosphatase PhoE
VNNHGNEVCLVRHGETAWSLSGQHTGSTDIPLTDNGKNVARELGEKLSGSEFAAVWSSPLSRALETARLAGFTDGVRVDDRLKEWDYGEYEGLTTREIRQKVPDWLVWTHGCPGGESLQQVSDRADRAISYALKHMESRDVLFLGHGHFSRAVLTRWVELEISEGIRFAMVAASIAVCGFEHGVRQISALGLTGHRHSCLPA